MNLREHLEKWQVRWAERKGIALGSPPGNPASRVTGYVRKVQDNLFEPLSERVKRQLIASAGGELDAPDGQSGNLYAVCSSSALCMNLFHHWSRLLEMAPGNSRPSIEPLLTACGLPIRQLRSIDFEVPNTVNPHFKAAPHVDVQLSFDGGPWKCAGIEAKFCEPYGDNKLGGLFPVYISQTALWQGWPNVRALAKELTPSDRMHSYLHAAQLLKHLLGLRKQNGTNFILVYLWFDVPGTDAAMEHRREIKSFSEVLKHDRIAFISRTYQEVFEALRCREDGLEGQLVAYLLERYVSGMPFGEDRARR
jgi:hypothetical protein